MTKQQKLWTLLTILSTFLWACRAYLLSHFELEPKLTPLFIESDPDANWGTSIISASGQL